MSSPYRDKKKSLVVFPRASFVKRFWYIVSGKLHRLRLKRSKNIFWIDFRNKIKEPEAIAKDEDHFWTPEQIMEAKRMYLRRNGWQ